MKQYKRSARFNRLLQEEISEIMRRHLKDPRIGLASITRVETTEDLRSCKVYVSILEESKAQETIEALQRARGIIRGELLHRIRARRVPELRFYHDTNIAYSIHISEVLNGLNIREREEDNGEA